MKVENASTYIHGFIILLFVPIKVQVRHAKCSVLASRTSNLISGYDFSRNFAWDGGGV